jgi:hypothetical protein
VQITKRKVLLTDSHPIFDAISGTIVQKKIGAMIIFAKVYKAVSLNKDFSYYRRPIPPAPGAGTN